MNVYIENGWLVCSYAGPELAKIEIEFKGARFAAFLDFDSKGRRVAKVRQAPTTTTEVLLFVNDTVWGRGKVYL